jgi:cell division protein FtsZ
MGSGENRALTAAAQAVASPLLETSMEGAHSILLSITGGKDLSLWEINEAAKAVSEAAHPEANIIFGAMIDENLEDQVWVTVVATGYDGAPHTRRIEEPKGEPRVRRGQPAVDRSTYEEREELRRRTTAAVQTRERPREREREPEPARRGNGLRVTELDVPEFMPHR